MALRSKTILYNGHVSEKLFFCLLFIIWRLITICCCNVQLDGLVLNTTLSLWATTNHSCKLWHRYYPFFAAFIVPMCLYRVYFSSEREFLPLLGELFSNQNVKMNSLKKMKLRIMSYQFNTIFLLLCFVVKDTPNIIYHVPITERWGLGTSLCKHNITK